MLFLQGNCFPEALLLFFAGVYFLSFMIESFMWMPYPYVRYTIYLISGILVSSHAEKSMLFEVWLIISVTLFMTIFLSRKWLHPAFCNTLTGVLGFLIIFSAGGLRFEQNDRRNNPVHLIRYKESISHYTAVVISDVVIRKNYSKTKVFINSVKTEKGWEKAEANALLYVKQDTLPFTVDYGDKLILRGSPRRIRGPSNPKAFDYQNYLALQNIFHQHFVDRNDIVKYGHSSPNPILYDAFQIKKRTKNIIRDAIRNHRERSIVLSLLIGQKEELDPQVKRIYSNVGAMHVLAVSGLHVGIVYLLFSSVLGFLKNHKKGKWLFLVICSMALWFYALLTGMSTSVLRAVVMFTVILLGDTLGRRSNIYNNIALAAFLLLLFDPFYLFQVGFQLSFIAVAGIVYLQPKIAAWLHFNNTVSDKIWKLTAVSLAAQLATFPISIYYFHQFPTYFWLTNLLVIPSATAIIVLGIFVILLGALDISMTLFSALLEKLVFLTNEGLVLINALPSSSIHDLYFTAWDTLLIYAGIMAMLLFLSTFKIHYFGLSFLLLFLFSSGSLFHYFDTLKQRQVVFYDISKTCAIDFIDGRRQDLIIMTNRKTVGSVLHAAIANYRIARGLNTSDLAGSKTSFNKFKGDGGGRFKFFNWSNIVFLLLDKKMSFYQDQHKKIKINYLLISNQAVQDFSQITRHFEFDKIIITNLNSFKYASNLYDYCLRNHLKVHSIVHDGALVLNLREE